MAAVYVEWESRHSAQLAEIMRAAGLTHGGFYKHFESRDDLIAKATERP